MALGDRAFKHPAVRRYPHSPTGKSRRDVGYDRTLRVDHEAQQLFFRKNAPCDDAAAFPHVGGRIVGEGCMQIHALSCASSAAASSGAAGSSIQPAFTRASMIMAFASSEVRLNLSRAPGTRTRSFSLLIS